MAGKKSGGLTGADVPHKNYLTTGARIRLARKRSGLKQSTLGKLVGVTQASVANWENGAHGPRAATLDRVATALGVAPEWLAGEQREPAARQDLQARYLKAGLVHAPVIALETSVRLLAMPPEDPHAFAQDYVPVALASSTLVAVHADDAEITGIVPRESLVIIDYLDRRPQDGGLCLATVDGRPALRIWRDRPRRLVTCPAAPMANGLRVAPSARPATTFEVIGCARAAIQFHQGRRRRAFEG